MSHHDETRILRKIEQNTEQTLLTAQYTARATREMLIQQLTTNKLLARILKVDIADFQIDQAELGFLSQIEQNTNPNRTTQAHISFGGNMAATPGTQAIGSTLTATFVPIEADGITQTPGATLTTPPTFTIDNTAVATLVDNGNGTATITGVSAGTVNVTATGGVFTDQDGTATAPLSATNTDTVTQPTGRTVSAQINFA